MAKRKLTRAERHAAVLANARRTRELAERARARLDADKPPA
jgi:hypothetical protein